MTKTLHMCGPVALAVVLTLSACANQPDLAGASRDLNQQPEAALAAQIAAPAEVSRKLASSGIARTPFGASVRQAVQSHPSIRGQRYRIEGARAAVDGAAAAYRPRLSVGLDAGVTTSTSTTSGTRIGPVVSLTKLVYDGAAARYTHLSRGQALVVAEVDRVIESTALSLRAVETRVNCVRARMIVDISLSNLRAHEDLVQKIQARVDAGAGSQADLLAGRSRLASASAKLIEAERALAQADAAYFEIYGIEPPASLSLPPRVPANLIRSGVPATVRNAQLVRLDFAINQALFDLASLQAGRQPALVAGVSVGPTAGASGISADARANLGVRMELLSGGEREARVKEAQAHVDDLKSQREQTQRQVVKALDFARSDQQAGGERLKSAELALAAAEESLVTSNEQFQVGRRSITQMLDAQRDRTEAAILKVNTQADLIIGSYAALGLTGDLLALFGIDPLSDAEGG